MKQPKPKLTKKQALNLGGAMRGIDRAVAAEVEAPSYCYEAWQQFCRSAEFRRALNGIVDTLPAAGSPGNPTLAVVRATSAMWLAFVAGSKA